MTMNILGLSPTMQNLGNVFSCIPLSYPKFHLWGSLPAASPWRRPTHFRVNTKLLQWNQKIHSLKQDLNSILSRVNTLLVGRWCRLGVQLNSALLRPGSWYPGCFSAKVNHPLGQESATIFWKGLGNNYFQLCGPNGPCDNSPLPL